MYVGLELNQDVSPLMTGSSTRRRDLVVLALLGNYYLTRGESEAQSSEPAIWWLALIALSEKCNIGSGLCIVSWTIPLHIIGAGMRTP